MITACNVRNVSTDILDDARTFVTEYPRKRKRVILIAHDRVSVANADCKDAHEHFIGRRRPDSHILDDKRRPLAADDRRFGRAALWALVRHEFGSPRLSGSSGQVDRFELLVGGRGPGPKLTAKPPVLDTAAGRGDR